MKKWNTPEVKELNIAETANGIFDSEVESLLIFNDSKKPSTPNPDVKPELPNGDGSSTDGLS